MGPSLQDSSSCVSSLSWTRGGFCCFCLFVFVMRSHSSPGFPQIHSKRMTLNSCPSASPSEELWTMMWSVCFDLGDLEVKGKRSYGPDKGRAQWPACSQDGN